MYRHILIPTDGSKLAHKGVAHGLSLAKAVGARVIVLTVEPISSLRNSRISKKSGVRKPRQF